MTPSGHHVAMMDAEQAKLVAAKGIKLNPREWVKKRDSQIGEIDKLNLKLIALHDDINKVVLMTQPVEFVATDLVLVS